MYDEKVTKEFSGNNVQFFYVAFGSRRERTEASTIDPVNIFLKGHSGEILLCWM